VVISLLNLLKYLYSKKRLNAFGHTCWKLNNQTPTEIIFSIMQQKFCHIYIYNFSTLFYHQYFDIETLNPFVQTRLSGKQAVTALQCSRRMPKWQYLCEILCFAGKHKNPSKS